jgi:hypothetical protein
MTRPITVRQVATAQNDRPDAPGGGSAPFLVLDLGRGRDPHQARCRQCRWRSSWRATARQVWTEHARHQRATHGPGRGRRGGRRGRLGLVTRGRAR